MLVSLLCSNTTTLFPPSQNNITGVPGVIDADLISYNSLCSLHVFMGRGGLIQAMALVQDYFIINHDPLNSGNYIHKEITSVSVVGYI